MSVLGAHLPLSKRAMVVADSLSLQQASEYNASWFRAIF